ncbi:MAG: NAD(P)H-dependent oxidoreductase [Phycisphaerae bacterium]|jgi:FMN-dependent NADH-azoreductase
MAKLLYIQASPRGDRSKSNNVADAFIEAYKKANPQDQIEKLNLFEADLPAFDGFTIQAKYTLMHGKNHSEQEAAAWKVVEGIIEHFKSADKYVLSVPMWNFGIPYRLKQYIDIIVQPGYTFGYDNEKGYQGLVGNKPFTVILARGGEYKKGSDMESYDIQSRYIEVILSFIGVTNINKIVVEPTLQGGPDDIQKKIDEAVKKTQQLARSF